MLIEPIGVFLPSAAVPESTSEEVQTILPSDLTRAPVVAEKIAPHPVQSSVPSPLFESEELTAAPTRVTAAAMAPQPVFPVEEPRIEGVSPEVVSPANISPVNRFTAAELEDHALIKDSARRSDAPSPSPHSDKVGANDEPRQYSTEAPETPEIESKATIPPPVFEEALVKNKQKEGSAAAPPASALESTGGGAPNDAALVAPAIEKEPEETPLAAAMPNAKLTVVEKDILPAVVLEEGADHKGLKKVKKNRGVFRGPLHKAAKEIRKAFQ
jgi:hypothetical protein